MFAPGTTKSSAAVTKRKRAPVATGTTTAAAGGDDGSAGKKLLVKNLAFESSNRELRQLFGSFGQLKSVRMPRKFDGYVSVDTRPRVCVCVCVRVLRAFLWPLTGRCMR